MSVAECCFTTRCLCLLQQDMVFSLIIAAEKELSEVHSAIQCGEWENPLLIRKMTYYGRIKEILHVNIVSIAISKLNTTVFKL